MKIQNTQIVTVFPILLLGSIRQPDKKQLYLKAQHAIVKYFRKGLDLFDLKCQSYLLSPMAI